MDILLSLASPLHGRSSILLPGQCHLRVIPTFNKYLLINLSIHNRIMASSPLNPIPDKVFLLTRNFELNRSGFGEGILFGMTFEISYFF